MKTLLRAVGLLLAGLGLLFLTALIHVQGVSYSLSFYQQEFEKLGQAEELGTSLDQLELFSHRTTRFLRGQESDPNLRLVLYGQERWLLNNREITHMLDVQQLFRLARRVTVVLLATFGLASLWLFRRGLQPFLRFIALAAVCALSIGLLGGWLVSQDFTSAFDSFHLLAFTNDLWQLNPAEDQLINLLPEQFFADAAIIAAWRSCLTLAVVALTASFASFRLVKPKLHRIS